MSKSAILITVGSIFAVSAIIWMFIVAIGPCHSQHAELRYHEAYTTRHCTMHQKIGDYSSQCVMWRTDRHPARCAWTTVCDIRCNDWDKGQKEKHPEHEPHRTANVIDPRCPIGAEGQGHN
jgi:hypothetical protein